MKDSNFFGFSEFVSLCEALKVNVNDDLDELARKIELFKKKDDGNIGEKRVKRRTASNISHENLFEKQLRMSMAVDGDNNVGNASEAHVDDNEETISKINTEEHEGNLENEIATVPPPPPPPPQMYFGGSNKSSGDKEATGSKRMEGKKATKTSEITLENTQGIGDKQKINDSNSTNHIIHDTNGLNSEKKHAPTVANIDFSIPRKRRKSTMSKKRGRRKKK